MKLTTTITITRGGVEVDVPVVGHCSRSEKCRPLGPRMCEGHGPTVEIESIDGDPPERWNSDIQEQARAALWDAAADRLETLADEDSARCEDADEARRERFSEEGR